jgi:hypothetical protein
MKSTREGNCFRLVLYRVHGQLNGQFSATKDWLFEEKQPNDSIEYAHSQEDDRDNHILPLGRDDLQSAQHAHRCTTSERRRERRIVSGQSLSSLPINRLLIWGRYVAAPLSVGQNNQAKHADHAHHVVASNRDANAKTAIYWTDTSDCAWDVRLQVTDVAIVAATIVLHTRDPLLASLPKEALEALARSYDDVLAKYAQDGPHNQIESNRAIGAEVMESETGSA